MSVSTGGRRADFRLAAGRWDLQDLHLGARPTTASVAIPQQAPPQFAKLSFTVADFLSSCTFRQRSLARAILEDKYILKESTYVTALHKDSRVLHI
jgi:hypothetical protein